MKATEVLHPHTHTHTPTHPHTHTPTHPHTHTPTPTHPHTHTLTHRSTPVPSQDRTNREARSILVGRQEREEGKQVERRKAKAQWRPSWRDGVAGAVLGVLSAMALARLGLIGMIPVLRGDHLYGVAAIAGALLGISRLRALPWTAAGLSAAGMLLIGYTPLVNPLIRECVRRDPLARADAVVVLSSDIFRDGQMMQSAQARFLRGYEVVREGYAPRMIITRLHAPKPSYRPALDAQLDRLDLDFPIEETAPVRNTRDEALAVARLAEARGWSRIILVSDASHLRRAGAAFEKAGLEVLCSPSADREYDLESLDTPDQRLNAFRDWVWEAVGYQTYRRNGWI